MGLSPGLASRDTSGAVFLGLDGVVIKAHGGADADVFSGAIEIGASMARGGLLDKIRDMIMLANENVAVLDDEAAQESACEAAATPPQSPPEVESDVEPA